MCNLLDGMVAIEGGLGSRSGEIYNDLPDRCRRGALAGSSGSQRAQRLPGPREEFPIPLNTWFSAAIPLAAFLYVPVHLALAGQTDRYLERAAKIGWGLMI